ncbi:putative protein kinase RLK-Pelle-RLCK-XII-1 family [Dioscorea sansibarensis]
MVLSQYPGSIHAHHPTTSHSVLHHEGATLIRQYTLAELMVATRGFAHQCMLSKDGNKLANFVYKGRLHGGQPIAVKRFSKDTWPDAKLFREVANRAGRLRHRRLVNLIEYCCDGDKRLLLAEFMPSDSLATHLIKDSLLFLDVICLNGVWDSVSHCLIRCA